MLELVKESLSVIEWSLKRMVKRNEGKDICGSVSILCIL